MALKQDSLYNENSRGPLPRMHAAEGPGAVLNKQYVAGASETIPICMPVQDSSGKVVEIDAADLTAGTDEVIYGFIYPTAVARDASDDVLCTVLMKGQVHFDDVVAAIEERDGVTLNGTQLTNLRTILRKAATRQGGMDIDGLTLKS